MILAVDAGNSRVKWGIFDGDWLAQGAVTNSDIVRLGEAWKHYGRPHQIVVSNVAGEKVRSLLSVLFIRWRLAPLWIRAKKTQCGVTNRYSEPHELGCDRWAALIGAWHSNPTPTFPTPTLVVSLGTAMTVDALNEAGEFVGGIIVPGITVMQECLARKTSTLEVLPGQFKPFPENTADAIFTGAILALAGAVDRMVKIFMSGSERIVVTGGGAPLLLPHLPQGTQHQENLVLKGLIHIAQEKVTA